MTLFVFYVDFWSQGLFFRDKICYYDTWENMISSVKLKIMFHLQGQDMAIDSSNQKKKKLGQNAENCFSSYSYLANILQL